MPGITMMTIIWVPATLAFLPAEPTRSFLILRRQQHQLDGYGPSLFASPASSLPHHHRREGPQRKAKQSREESISGGRRPERRDNQRQKQRKISRPTLETQLDFARNGHCVLRQIVEPETVHELRQQLQEHARQHELEAWQQKVQVLASNNNNGSSSNTSRLNNCCNTVQDCQRELERLLGTETPLPFLQYFHTWRRVPLVHDVCCRLAETASILLDVPSVRLYQDAIFWKRPEDGATPWHADARMAPFDTSRFLTFWIPLQYINNVSNHQGGGGGLVFCSKSHSDFALPYWHGNPEQWDFSLEDRYASERIVDYMPLAVGDATVHHGWTLHCADAISNIDNNQKNGRMALAISFVDARAPVRKEFANVKKETTTSTSITSGDDEDAWGYRDWVRDVPAGSNDWDHSMVPILWPPSSQRRTTTQVHRNAKKKKAS